MALRTISQNRLDNRERDLDKTILAGRVIRVLVSLALGALAWAGLWLGDLRVRTLLPLSS